MGEKDKVEKLLEDYEDVFADIFNVLLFEEEIIKPEELLETKVKSQYKADTSKIHEMERDVAKVWKEEVTFALLGIENQTVVDKMMPLRVLAYDGTSYRTQLLNNKSLRDIYPVVTIVLYFGKEPWKQPTNLKEVIQQSREIPKKLDSYINDYHIHVFDIPRLSKEKIEQFKSDFGIVADFFRQTKAGDYVPSQQTIQHKDEVLKLLSVFAKSKNFDIMVEKGESKEVSNMCEVIDRIKAEERAEGKIEGKTESIIKVLKNLMLTMHLTLQEAMDAIQLDEGEQKQYRILIEEE